MASISVHRHHVLEIEIEGKPQIAKVAVVQDRDNWEDQRPGLEPLGGPIDIDPSRNRKW